MTIFTLAFWLAALERGLKTLAQTAAAMLVAAGTGILDTDWVGVASVAAMALIVSILTSVGTGAVSADGSPAIGGTEVLPARRAYTPDDPARE